jgi:hypothetical protein
LNKRPPLTTDKFCVNFLWFEAQITRSVTSVVADRIICLVPESQDHMQIKSTNPVTYNMGWGGGTNWMEIGEVWCRPFNFLNFGHAL